MHFIKFLALYLAVRSVISEKLYILFFHLKFLPYRICTHKDYKAWPLYFCFVLSISDPNLFLMPVYYYCLSPIKIPVSKLMPGCLGYLSCNFDKRFFPNKLTSYVCFNFLSSYPVLKYRMCVCVQLFFTLYVIVYSLKLIIVLVSL